MAKLTILAGDFYKVDGSYTLGKLVLRNKQNPIIGEFIPVNQLETIAVANEENIKKLSGTVGWGAVGAVALGPVGLLAGLLLGGKGKEVTFIAQLKDGRKFMATTDNKTFKDLQAAVF